ncbi:MAG: MurR/RpiR family transcriptional regulator [Pseudomonadota bacterium]
MQAITSAPELLSRLRSIRGSLAPELAKAADFVLENQREVGLSSIRSLAARAELKPNALVRLAAALGFKSFEEMRELFRDEIRKGSDTYPDRARWLQSLSQRDELGQLYADIAEKLTGNLESLFATADYRDMQAAAHSIVEARRTYVLGVGVANAAAQNFAYVGSMAIDNVHALPNGGMLPADRLAHSDERDVLVALTFYPYRTEVISAVKLARELGVTIIALSDTHTSPIMREAAHGFVVPIKTPQFFISTVALTAFFEALTAFVVAEAGPDVVRRIDTFHKQRYKLGIYAPDAT